MDMESGMRIDKHLPESCSKPSRSYIQKLLKSGQVLVNKESAEASYVVPEGDHIRLEISAAVEPEIEAEAMDSDILHEDQGTALINKPKGMMTHPAIDHYSHTLVNSLMYHYKDQFSGINGVTKPGTVHRVDMDTTGAFIACKNGMAYNFIAVQLKEHSITRWYQAIIHGVIKEEERTVVAPIGRHQTGCRETCINCSSGRSAITHYRVLQRFGQLIYAECRLETGRTHQVRVHMTSLHYPLLGDHVYDPVKCLVPGLTGQTLHAGTLGIVHPHTGEYMRFAVPLPEYFDRLLCTLR